MKAVLVVRKFDDFSRILTLRGFPVINCPTIETVRRADSGTLGAKIACGAYDGIFLTSRKATEIAGEEFFDRNFGFGGRIYVLGKSSFERLRGRNLDLFFDENFNTVREMLARIPPEDLENKRFLFIRGDRSLGAIADFLKDKATVDEAVVYETRKIEIAMNLKGEIAAKLKSGEIVAACFFSPSGAESFLEQFGAESLHQIRIATIGRTTAEYFAARNLNTDFTSSKASAEDFAVELTDYLKKF